MAVYIVTGKLGSGKTLCTVGKIRDYLEQGRRVATNLDLNLVNMLSETSKQSVLRLPDKPRVEDMQALGDGCEESNESKYGLIVLDELGTWFNSRNWRDKERLSLIDWFLHARKHHWDIFFIVQSIDSLDGQLVNSLCEHLVVCKRTDRLSVPIIGSFIRSIGFDKVFPKVHVAKVYYGSTESSMAVDRWWYRGKDLYNCYDTDQKFSDDQKLISVPSKDKKGNVLLDETGNIIYENDYLDMRASYTVLAPFYQNAIQCQINLHDQLEKLSGKKSGLKTARPSDGGFLQRYFFQQKFSVIAMFLLVLLSAYGLNRDNTESIVIKNASASEITPVLQPIKTEVIEQVELEVDDLEEIQLDHFQTILKGSVIKFETFVSDGNVFHAKLRIKGKEINETITLDDLRLNGYWITKEGRKIIIQKDEFKVLVKV